MNALCQRRQFTVTDNIQLWYREATSERMGPTKFRPWNWFIELTWNKRIPRTSDWSIGALFRYFYLGFLNVSVAWQRCSREQHCVRIQNRVSNFSIRKDTRLPTELRIPRRHFKCQIPYRIGVQSCFQETMNHLPSFVQMSLTLKLNSLSYSTHSRAARQIYRVPMVFPMVFQLQRVTLYETSTALLPKRHKIIWLISRANTISFFRNISRAPLNFSRTHTHIPTHSYTLFSSVSGVARCNLWCTSSVALAASSPSHPIARVHEEEKENQSRHSPREDSPQNSTSLRHRRTLSIRALSFRFTIVSRRYTQGRPSFSSLHLPRGCKRSCISQLDRGLTSEGARSGPRDEISVEAREAMSSRAERSENGRLSGGYFQPRAESRSSSLLRALQIVPEEVWINHPSYSRTAGDRRK